MKSRTFQMTKASQGDCGNSLLPSLLNIPEAETDAAVRPLRVMIVEDEAIIAMGIEWTLEELGAEIVGVAISAAEAISLATLHRPDCVTMDINIKGDRDGISAAIELYEKLGIRVIFISAYGNDETRVRAAAANPFAWLEKPIRAESLKAALGIVLEEK